MSEATAEVGRGIVRVETDDAAVVRDGFFEAAQTGPAVGSGARFTLRDACRAVERVTEREHERWLEAPERETAAPERAAGMER